MFPLLPNQLEQSLKSPLVFSKLVNLVNEHENNASVPPRGAREERKGIGMGEKLVAKSPVDGGGGRQGERKDIQSGH